MANDDELEAAFAAARWQDQPSPEFQARVLATATAMQPKPQSVDPLRRAVPPAPVRNFWAEVGLVLGGWRAAGGLSAAMALGFWLGISDPSGLLEPAGSVDSLELMPGANDLFASQTGEG